MMLHDYLWSMRLGDVLGQPFSRELRNRIARAGEFVYQLQDESTGRVPCYGQDDGALILPLSDCDYRDYRPVVQAISVLTTGQRRLQAGPWDEDLFWLFGITPVDSPVPMNADEQSQSEAGPNQPGIDSRHDFDTTEGGYATLRSRGGFVVTRAGGFRHRPAQADMLHVDLWWRGQNIAIDPGTYSYNAPPPWNNPFAHTAYHNTVTVDGRDQMERVSRFLWLPWLVGTSFGRNVPCEGDVSCWNGEHNGYQRLADPVTHRRGIVRLGDDHWLIIDTLRGRVTHDFRLHWLLLDVPYKIDQENSSIELETPAGHYRLATASSSPTSPFLLVRASENSAAGWRSCHYHSREPALSVSMECHAEEVVFATMLGPAAVSPLIERDQIQVQCAEGDAVVLLDLNHSSGTPLVTNVTAGGTLNPTLPVATGLRRIRTEARQCTYC